MHTTVSRIADRISVLDAGRMIGTLAQAQADIERRFFELVHADPGARWAAQRSRRDLAGRARSGVGVIIRCCPPERGRTEHGGEFTFVTYWLLGVTKSQVKAMFRGFPVPCPLDAFSTVPNVNYPAYDAIATNHATLEDDMKKHAAGAALVAAVGLSALSTAPAAAAPIVFDSCQQAYDLGIGNIPEGQPGYSRDLDRPYDGVACESGGFVYDATRVPGYVAPESPVPPVPPVPGQPGSGVFANCTEARAAGAVNIPASDPRYGLHLDRDRDGFGCDADGTDGTDLPLVPPTTGGGYDQMDQVPVGGADTGVAVEESTGVSGLALGGLALAAAAGATIAVRRRATRA